MKKTMIYVKPMVTIISARPCGVICNSRDKANWGNQKGTWPDEGHTPSGNPSGVDVGEDEGVIDSRAKQNSWSIWDE